MKFKKNESKMRGKMLINNIMYIFMVVTLYYRKFIVNIYTIFHHMWAFPHKNRQIYKVGKRIFDSGILSRLWESRFSTKH
jgi:hypothetical protein